MLIIFIAVFTIMSGKHIDDASDSSIAGFPQTKARRDKPRAVTFSRFSTMLVFPRADDKKAHYSRPDIESFKREAMLDVRALRRILASTPAAEVGEGVLLNCIGLEGLLSQDVMEAAMAARRAHVRAVLGEHRDQVRRGVGSAEMLALVSMQSSLRAQRRAERIAVGYLRLATSEDI